MRLPIALSPLNILLLVLMLLAPYLGSAAKQYVQKKKQVEKLELMISKARERKKVSPQSSASHAQENQAAIEENPINAPAEKTEPQLSSSHVVEEKGPLVEPDSIETAIKEFKPAEKTETSRKQLFEALKKFARARDFQKAEETFLEHLESTDLSPMESLDKYSKFQKMFQKLSDDYLESSSNKSI